MPIDLLMSIAIGALTPLIAFGLHAFASRRSEARARQPLNDPGQTSTSSFGNPAKRTISRIDASPALRDALVRPPHSVSFPVSSLAGLPVSRPVAEGRVAQHKPGGRPARGRKVLRTRAASDCPTCNEKRAAGRIYCIDCGRRLTPFLP